MKRFALGMTLTCAALFSGMNYISDIGSSHAQNDQFLSRLQGNWRGDGKTRGMSATIQLKWDWVLGSRFLRLTLSNELKMTTGESRTFEGHAYYRSAGEGKYEGNWFDSQGGSFTIKGSVEGQSLTAIWGPSGQELGKSVYSLLPDSNLEVVDSLKQKDGSWKEFGKFLLKHE